MNLRSTMTAFAIALVAATLAIAADTPSVLATYYFPRSELCTIMVDFQKMRPAVEDLKGEKRTVFLVQNMAAEFDRNGAKCGNAAKIRMLAVFIKGVDVYGRTDFGNRVNLLKVETTPQSLRRLAQAGDKIMVGDIKAVSDLETY